MAAPHSTRAAARLAFDMNDPLAAEGSATSFEFLWVKTVLCIGDPFCSWSGRSTHVLQYACHWIYYREAAAISRPIRRLHQTARVRPNVKMPAGRKRAPSGNGDEMSRSPLHSRAFSTTLCRVAHYCEFAPRAADTRRSCWREMLPRTQADLSAPGRAQSSGARRNARNSPPASRARRGTKDAPAFQPVP